MSNKTKTTHTPESLANAWIAELKAAGFSYEEMIAIFAEARRKYNEYKKMKEQIANYNVCDLCNVNATKDNLLYRVGVKAGIVWRCEKCIKKSYPNK